MTVHWPPQPCVEDEVTSLEHEQIPPGMAEGLKSDDDPAISRGAVNQTPIIQDSSQSASAARQNVDAESKTAPANTDLNSSDDGTGPITPPPIDRCERGRYSKANRSDPPSPQRSSAPRSADNGRQSSRGRPEVTRIDTSLGADLHAMATGTRRAPSPYSYSRASANSASPITQTAQVLSPTNLRSSPVDDPASRALKFSPNSAAEIRATFSDEPDTAGRERRRHRSKSRARSRSHPREPSARRDARSSRQRLNESSSDESERPSYRGRRENDRVTSATSAQRYQSERDNLTPPHTRRQSKDPYYSSTSEDYPRQAASRRPSDRSHPESPYGSSNDEAGKYRYGRNDRAFGTSQRASMHRREPPHFDRFPDEIKSRRPAQLSADDMATVMVDRRRRSNLETTVPMTADAARNMEDYFEQAFRENQSRRSNADPTSRSPGSTLASPMSSPPRTPKSERLSAGYFDTEPERRPAQRSRPPSMDENQAAVLKNQASLLSAATAGATMAALGSSTRADSHREGSQPRSSWNPTTYEERNSQGYRRTSSNLSHPQINSVAAPAAERMQESRMGPLDIDTRNMPLPQRAATYSGLGQPKGILKNPIVPIATADQASPTPGVNRPQYSPSRRATDVSPSAQASSQSGGTLRFPVCPRPKPVSGYQDWYSIKEMSNLDICPTCMEAMRTTRFITLLVPSLPRPYNEPSVCVMSKPWARVAVLRAHLQRRADLSYLRALSTVPMDTRPCTGSRPDIRSWFTMEDPLTREDIPNFVACSACVRTIEIVFPELRKVMGRPNTGLNYEKVCSLHTDSKHFPAFVDQFEQAAARCAGRKWRSSDIQPLVDTIRKACRLRGCCRDELLPTRAWHFMSDLPEFTICEECYDDVVWPVNDKAIARDISQTLKLVPAPRNPSRFTGISCQLYSERMRRVFRNAVATRNVGPLRDAVRTRQAAQLRLHEMNKLYEADQKYGIDRRSEIGKNNEIWRSLE